MIIFAFKKGELKEKTQDANFSLPIKNPNSLLKNGFRIRIPKSAKNWADSRFGFGLPTLPSIFTKESTQSWIFKSFIGALNRGDSFQRTIRL